MGVLLED